MTFSPALHYQKHFKPPIKYHGITVWRKTIFMYMPFEILHYILKCHSLFKTWIGEDCLRHNWLGCYLLYCRPIRVPTVRDSSQLVKLPPKSLGKQGRIFQVLQPCRRPGLASFWFQSDPTLADAAISDVN